DLERRDVDRAGERRRGERRRAEPADHERVDGVHPDLPELAAHDRARRPEQPLELVQEEADSPCAARCIGARIAAARPRRCAGSSSHRPLPRRNCVRGLIFTLIPDLEVWRGSAPSGPAPGQPAPDGPMKQPAPDGPMKQPAPDGPMKQPAPDGPTNHPTTPEAPNEPTVDPLRVYA